MQINANTTTLKLAFLAHNHVNIIAESLCSCVYDIILCERFMICIQAPVLVLNVTVVEARQLEAKDADGRFIRPRSTCFERFNY